HKSASYQKVIHMLGSYGRNSYLLTYLLIYLEQHYLILRLLEAVRVPVYFFPHSLIQSLLAQIDLTLLELQVVPVFLELVLVALVASAVAELLVLALECDQVVLVFLLLVLVA